MDAFETGRMIRVFVDERDRRHGQPLYTAVVDALRARKIAGATVFRGVEGFGAHGEVHGGGPFALTPNLPIVIEIVERPDVVESLVGLLTELVPEGLITIERVEFRRFGGTP